jgi:hypothetical protein
MIMSKTVCMAVSGAVTSASTSNLSRNSKTRQKIDEIVERVVGKDLEWLNEKLISPGDAEYIRCVNQKDKYVSASDMQLAASRMRMPCTQPIHLHNHAHSLSAIVCLLLVFRKAIHLYCGRRNRA